ncbi:MAG TPA: hypothetical protein VEK07_20145 [Polyangiaceae bacterium]|nr:hypothetical protein [Polyangiaceae bacterium]
MTKRRMAAGFVGGATAALCACTKLLGDFQTGPGNGADGGLGSSSVLPAEGGNADGTTGGNGSTQDGGSDAAATDASDAALALLPCEPVGGAVVTGLGTISRSSSNNQNTVRLFNVGSSNQQQYRAIVPESSTTGPTIFHTYSFGNNNGGASPDAPIPYNGNVIALARYQGGIAALVSENLFDAGTTVPVLDVYTIADDEGSWSAPNVLTSGGPLPTCLNQTSGALWVLDPTAPSYLYDVTYQPCPPSPSTTVHLVGQTGSAPLAMWPLPLEDMVQPDGGDAGNTVDAAAQGFSVAGITAAPAGGSSTPIFAIANTSNGGPQPGIGSTLFTSSVQDLGNVTVRELPLVAPSDLMQALSVQTLPTTGSSPGNVGLVFLEANLTVQNVTPLFYVGALPPSQMTTLDPSSDLPATALSGISDIPINAAAYHWESFASPFASDNMLGVGPVFTTGAGLNFLWWDASGALRARSTSASALFADAGVILGGDVTFTSAPFPALGQFEAVFLVAQPDASTLTDVMATQFECTNSTN